MTKFGINLLTLKVERIRPKKSRVWYYQHAGEEKQELCKSGKWWYYNPPGGGGETGCDTLEGAKGDLALYEGTKVWSELI